MARRSAWSLVPRPGSRARVPLSPERPSPEKHVIRRTSVAGILVAIATVIGYFFLPIVPRADRVWFSIVLGTILLAAFAWLGIAELIEIRREQVQIRMSTSDLNGRFSETSRELERLLTDTRQDRHSGALYKGEIRNVSLRAATLHTLIDGLVHAVPSNRRTDLLHRIGVTVGATWSQDLLDEFRRYEGSNWAAVAHDTKGIMRRWAEYDASAGMGRFDFDELDDTGCGAVVLENSCLSRLPSTWPLDHFMAGYIEGTLRALLESDVSVNLVDPSTEVRPSSRFIVVSAAAPTAPVASP